MYLDIIVWRVEVDLGMAVSNQVWSRVFKEIFMPRLSVFAGINRWVMVGKYPRRAENVE